MSDLTARLLALSRCEHDDHSVGDEAAEEIERLESTLNVYANKSNEDFNAGMKAAAQRCAMIAHYEGSETCDHCNDILDTILQELGLEDK